MSSNLPNNTSHAKMGTLMHRKIQGATQFFKTPFDHAIDIGDHIEI
jgi:hypothetical protein